MSAIYGLIICKALSNPLQNWLCEVGGYLTSTTSYPMTANNAGENENLASLHPKNLFNYWINSFPFFAYQVQPAVHHPDSLWHFFTRHKYFEIRCCVLLTFQFLTPRVGQILSVFERPCGFYLHCFCSVGPELLGPSLFSSLDSETIKSKSRLAGFGGSSRWWPWSKRMGVLSIRYTPLVSKQQMMRYRSGEEMCDWCLSVCAARAWAWIHMHPLVPKHRFCKEGCKICYN